MISLNMQLYRACSRFSVRKLPSLSSCLLWSNILRQCSTTLYSKVNHARLDDVESADDIFAVVELGNKQFKVTLNDAIVADRLSPELFDIGSEAVLDKVLLLGSKSQTIVGQPYLPGSFVKVSVEEHKKDKKVIVFRKNRRKGFKRTKGHRRILTILRVIGISDPKTFEYKAANHFHEIIPANISSASSNIIPLDTTPFRKELESLLA